MPLTLSVLRGPSRVTPERREIMDGQFSIGRGPSSDWALQDPERMLSKRHCDIVERSGEWLVTDCSSNGTYLNGVSLERNQPHVLRDNDRLTLGTYEIEARISQERESEFDPQTFDRQTMAERRLTSDPFSMSDGDPMERARPSVSLPEDLESLATGDKITESPFVSPDHGSDLNESFQPPRTDKELLPADWDSDDELPPSTSPVPKAAVTASVAQPATEASPMPAAQPLPAAPALPTAPPLIKPPLSQHEPTDASVLAAFAAGAGMHRAPSGDPEATMRALGAAFHAVVKGLRRMMMARATVKGEFRIRQTMIRAAGNNPLKFSADDDDALAALLGIGRNAGMAPEQAITEAFRDMRLHELAVASAMQQAVRDTIAGLAPNRAMFGGQETAVDKALGLRKRAAWDNYCRLHADTMRALADDFDSVFGKSFGRAYEAALTSLSDEDLEA